MGQVDGFLEHERASDAEAGSVSKTKPATTTTTTTATAVSRPLPLSKPYVAGNEKRYVDEAIASGKLAGDGAFTKRVATLLEAELPAKRVLLTTSCTSALELAAILLAGDGTAPAHDPGEVIVPSFTFVSTVNAFLLHGWRPVFCDVRDDTGNVDVDCIAARLTKDTRAISVVHYAGAPCDMAPIMELAKERGIAVVEDAAQAVTAKVDGRHAGTIGDLGAFSFHDTKNFVCGEGGALVVNKDELVARAEIVREKGTNRSQFLQGHVDKYTWVDVGGSFLPSEMLAAFLLGQLENVDTIAAKRALLFSRYLERLASLEGRGLLRLPVVPQNVETNHHLFYVVVESADVRLRLMKHLNMQGIGAAFHYPALHLTPMGKRLHDGASLPGAEALGDRLLRLPLFCDMTVGDVDRVVDAVAAFFG